MERTPVLLSPGFIRGITVTRRPGSKGRSRSYLRRGLVVERLKHFLRGCGPTGEPLLGRSVAYLRLLCLRMLLGLIRGALLRLITRIDNRATRHIIHLIGDLIGINRHGLRGQQINAGTGNLGNGSSQGIAGAAESIHQSALFCLIIDIFHHNQHGVPIAQQRDGAAAIPDAPGIDDAGAEGGLRHLRYGLLGRHLRRRLLRGHLLLRRHLLRLHLGRRLLRPLIGLELLRLGLGHWLHRLLRRLHLRSRLLRLLITLLILLSGLLLHLLLVSAEIHDVIPPLLICLLYGLLGRGLIHRPLGISIAPLISGYIFFPIIEEAVVY